MVRDTAKRHKRISVSRPIKYFYNDSIYSRNCMNHTPTHLNIEIRPIKSQEAIQKVTTEVWLNAVSYTHLDVYKRQNQSQIYD